jgi:hypothetical protein
VLLSPNQSHCGIPITCSSTLERDNKIKKHSVPPPGTSCLNVYIRLTPELLLSSPSSAAALSFYDNYIS